MARATEARAGGGAAIDLAPHGLDLLAVTLGAKWETLTALTHTAVQDYTVDDGAVLAGRLSGGEHGGKHAGATLASLHVGYDTPDALPRRRLELIGTRASAVLENTMGQTPGGSFTLHDAGTGAARAVPFDAAADPFAATGGGFLGLRVEARIVPVPAGGGPASARTVIERPNARPRKGARLTATANRIWL